MKGSIWFNYLDVILYFGLVFTLVKGFTLGFSDKLQKKPQNPNPVI